MIDGNAAAGDAAARFWAFSVAVYGAPAVATACVALQDEFDLDVNLLLFCCWTATEGAPPLGDATMARAAAAIRPWRERAIAPLRAVRRDLKHDIANVAAAPRQGFRQRVAALELEAERIAQGLLVEAVPVTADQAPTPEQRLSAGAVNLAACAALAGVRPTPPLCNGLALILAAALGISAGRALTAVDAAIRSRAEGNAAL